MFAAVIETTTFDQLRHTGEFAGEIDSYPSFETNSTKDDEMGCGDSTSSKSVSFDDSGACLLNK